MKKILVVDDGFVFHMMYVEKLRENGHPVLGRTEFERLIDVVDKHDPDLVLIDILAANYRGLDIMKEVSMARRDLPFILCTSTFSNEIKSLLCCEKSRISVMSAADIKSNKTMLEDLCHTY